MKFFKRIINWAYQNNDVFYYISILSLVFAKTLGFYSGDMEYKLIMVFAMLCLGLKLLFTRYTLKEVIIMAVIGLYAVLIYLKTGYITFTITVLTLLGIKNVDVYDLMKKMLFVRVICISVLVTASVVGIVGNTVKDQYDDGLTYAYGFQSPNEFMVNVFITVAMFMYLNYKKLNCLHFLLSLYAFYAVYRVTNSMTGFMLGIFLVFVFLCLKLFDKLGKPGYMITRIISAAVIPTSVLCFIGTFAASVFFDVNNSLMFKMDQLITGRLKIQHQYWLNYGFSWLGKDISRAAARWDGVQINNGFLDSNYWCTFYKYGFVTEALFLACLVFASWYFYKKKNYRLTIIINVMCLYGLMEDFLISSVVNPFLLFVAFAIYDAAGKNKKVSGEVIRLE